MRFLNNNAAVLLFSCFVLALLVLAPPAMQGDEWNLATRFSVNHPFEVPNLVLQPNTPYMIRLHDSPAERRVVQIYNSDQSKMLTMFMAVSDERTAPTDNTQFTFIETEPGFPMPIKEWFYPGRLTGLEFVYPKDQAVEIARHAQEPILAASTNDLHDLSSITVESIGPIRGEAQAPVTSTAQNVTPQESPAVLEKPTDVEEAEQQQVTESETRPLIAQNDQSEIQREKPAEAPAVTEAPAAPAVTQDTTTTRELPQTAGELPLIALIGLLCLGAGLSLKVISSHN